MKNQACFPSLSACAVYRPLLAGGLVFLMLAFQARAYSFLCGTCEECPDAPYSPPPDQIGMAGNLGEEYRWNVPVLVYAFDPSFLDYYGSSGVAAVESAIASLNALPAWQYSRTGTSNSWNSAPLTGVPQAAGPGVIQPPVRIAFHKFTPPVFATDDSPAGAAQFAASGWGSFDGSTNPPVAYPAGMTPADAPLTVRLLLHPQNDYAATVEHVWQLPVPFGGIVALEISTDLITWTRLATVTNLGRPVDWDHTRSQTRKFYRVLPQ